MNMCITIHSFLEYKNGLSVYTYIVLTLHNPVPKFILDDFPIMVVLSFSKSLIQCIQVSNRHIIYIRSFDRALSSIKVTSDNIA